MRALFCIDPYSARYVRSNGIHMRIGAHFLGTGRKAATSYIVRSIF